eukprot:m.60338 g.60338  ORF g.60338 m.60338 type:complete len:117 (+) comp49332_c0_seq2:521-871(+)
MECLRSLFAVAVFLRSLSVDEGLNSSLTSTVAFQRSFRLKMGLLVLAWIFFLVYLPIGLAIVNFRTLPDGNYVYDDDQKHTMRTVSQFFSVMSLLAYIGTCSLDTASRQVYAKLTA